MDIKSISVPEIYKSSQDFRFFLEWFSTALSKVQYDIENLLDLYDPLRCPEDLLWMLAETIGYKFDDRLNTAFNRLVLIYFMSMIKNRGSKDGVTLAAEINLAQFRIQDAAKAKTVLNNRLEDTSIPVNTVYVTPHTADGYIDVVYFADKLPLDACIEYVRPVGMFLFQHAGVRYDARTKIGIDARLTNTSDIGMSFGPVQVGHYRREDYARLQKTLDTDGTALDPSHTKHKVWSRNSDYEDIADGDGTYESGTKELDKVNPAYRALYSMQISNNEEIVKSLVTDPIFSIGYGPQDVSTTYPDDYLSKITNNNGVVSKTNYNPYDTDRPWNLRYDRDYDESQTASSSDGNYDVMTLDADRSTDILNPRPAVNPVMGQMGDAIELKSDNSSYTKVDESGNITHT